MTSVVIRLKQKREGGRKVVEIQLPRRLLTALRSMNPESVRFNFGMNEQFEVDSSELHGAIAETYKKRRKKGQ